MGGQHLLTPLGPNGAVRWTPTPRAEAVATQGSAKPPIFGGPSARPAFGWPMNPASLFAVDANVLQKSFGVVNWQLPAD